MNDSKRRELGGAWALLAATTLAAGGCSSSTSAGGSGMPGAPANAPEWVHRGSRVQTGSIFGVGSAAGIKNTPLARDTAANRGRAEISRILEVYSASLMKDYMASTTAGDMSASSEEQHVEQAIKTFSANLMNGTEVKDFFLDAQGNTWFALVELNFERAKEAAEAQSKMSPGLKKWVEDNGPRVLDDMDKGTSPPPAPPPSAPPVASAPPPAPPVASAPPPAPPKAPPANDGPPAKVGGPAPKWTQGDCDRRRYLCGVGDGPDRKTADIDARAELARIFTATIQSVAQSFEGSAREVSSKTGEQWVEFQQVSQYSMVSTDKVVTMSEIIDRWQDGKGAFWSLAVIDRAQASNALRSQIEERDRTVGTRIGQARESTDNLTKIKNLKAAVRALVEREAMNSDLRVIQTNGQGIPAPYSIGDVLALLESAAAELKLGIALAGTGAERVRACLEDALTTRGYQIEFNVDEGSSNADIRGNFDVLINGTVRAISSGKVGGNEIVQTTVTLQLINGKTKKVLRTFTDSEKGTRPTLEAAASTSAFKLCQKKVPSIVSDIDRYFAR